MRELKLRVWDRIQEKMLKPQAISFDTHSTAPFAVSVPGRSWDPIGKYILLQWTGFLDSDGKDVYEGDLIKISSDIYKVIWNKSLAMFELLQLGSFSKCEISAVECGIIIGNEFQKSHILSEAL